MVTLTGTDGNAFMTLGVVKTAMRRYGLDEDEITYFDTEATAADYQNLMTTVMRYVTVR